VKSIHHLALGLVLLAVFSANCAGRPPEETVAGADDCIYLRQLNAWEAIGDRHLVAKLSAARYYLLTVDHGCPGLEVARYGLVSQRSSRMCGDGFSFLSFEHPSAGLTRCRVLGIERVESPDAARELVEARERG
jgi:hypothetical protein